MLIAEAWIEHIQVHIVWKLFVPWLHHRNMFICRFLAQIHGIFVHVIHGIKQIAPVASAYSSACTTIDVVPFHLQIARGIFPCTSFVHLQNAIAPQHDLHASTTTKWSLCIILMAMAGCQQSMIGETTCASKPHANAPRRSTRDVGRSC